MKLIDLCTKTLQYAFYALFLIVPLTFSGSTSELFELNKMWLTYGITTIIVTAWITKMILQKRVSIQRTPLDLPILLFLLSQIIATIFSLDSHVSFWGYYSRFNGGLLSTIAYLLLYYAFVTNFTTHIATIKKFLLLTLISGTLVMLWGLPSHFGYDPTCFVFRGTLDTACWTDAFKPTIRTFSTLGQPAWFAAYLAFLLPLAMVFVWKKQLRPQKKQSLSEQTFFWSFVLLAGLFYFSLLFTNTRAGFLGFAIADIILWTGLFFKKVFTKQLFFRYLILFHGIFFIGNFFFGWPINSLNQLTFAELSNQAAPPPPADSEQAPQAEESQGTAGTEPEVLITDSANIRLHVWQGAIDSWKQHPLFGTGVETFAFAYYQSKPEAHNLTSEWDYLYNKAHNEYLNYLTTTGIFGLGTYLWMIGLFLFLAGKYLWQTKKYEFDDVLVLALFAGYTSLLVTNFFGFSTVVSNLFLFLTPAFVFILAGKLTDKTLSFPRTDNMTTGISPYQWTAMIVLFSIACFIMIGLLRSWYADTAYALGSNLNRVGAYQDAYPKLLEAANIVANEPVYQDELAINLGTLATALFLQEDATNGAQFANNAIALNNQVVTNHPNNVVYWKNRVRLFYTLAQGDPEHAAQYYEEALHAILTAQKLAPTDAKIAYNVAILYNQLGQLDKAIEAITETIRLKPNYRDAYLALGLFYHTKAVDENNNVIDQDMQQKAIATYEEVLKISPNDEETKKTLQEWKAQLE